VRHAIALSKIPEHERRYLEQDPELAAKVLPEPPDLLEHEDHLSQFYLGERAATPPDQPLDKLRTLTLYERLYGTVNALTFVDCLRAMDAEFFTSRAPAPAMPPMAGE